MQLFYEFNWLTVFIVALLLFCIISRLYKVPARLLLSRAKHTSLRGHAKWSRRIAKLIRYFEYDNERFFCSDGAPPEIVTKRKQGMDRLVSDISSSCAQSINYSAVLERTVSDVQFTSTYRVPFPYRKHLAKQLRLGSIVTETHGVQMKDLDGNWRYDLTGSYGVNVFGYDFYKECIEEGTKKVKDIGPVLGPYHPIIKDNVEKIKTISGLDEVSFHMSGTEAVMQAVRLARYHTGRSHLVRLCGAYHGWWDGVQPGIGNQRDARDVYTLCDLNPNTLKVLETRSDIACVLINPLQALHPNTDAPGDATLVASDRATDFDKQKYIAWLKQIRHICTRRHIVLIFDEVFTGFRLAYRGAQEYFGIQADLVTYGKTLGGGLPVGVLAGRKDLMKRFKDDSPIDISFARGTFNSHPYVLGAMNEFLQRITSDGIQHQYHQAEELWNQRVANLNRQLSANNLPVRYANLHSIITTLYTQPSRYNWMFQFYLKNAGLELSWIGSGRMIMSFNYTDEDFKEVVARIISAAKQMKSDGWWWQSEMLSNQSIKRQFLREIINAGVSALFQTVREKLKLTQITKVRGQSSHDSVRAP